MGGVDVDDLYGLPLERFTPERNSMARELRRAGRRDEAAEVAALRKPSVAAWAVNQLVRTQKRGVDELFDAGDALGAAQEALLAGRGDGSSLRAAVEGERAAVEELTGAARGLLTADGHELSQSIIDRVSDTLHAAALDHDARAQVRDGRLERELRHIGLGTAAAPGAKRTTDRAGKRPGSAKRAGDERPGDERPGDERPPDDRAVRERAQARAEARAAARATEREARRRVERAERAARVAQDRRDRAATALDEAEAGLNEAEGELREAREQLGAAERAVRDAPV
jgi:hypothetical protein